MKSSTMIQVTGLSLVALSSYMSSTAHAFGGDVTAYGSAWEGGNCGYKKIWGSMDSEATKYFAAINQPQWDKSGNCGKCARVRCTDCDGGQERTVMITNRCPECAYGSLDLSDAAFKEVTGSDPSRKQIEWDWVDCPSTFVNGGMEFFIKGGSNPNWVAIQPRNTKQTVTEMQVKCANGQWATMQAPQENTIDAYYFLYKGDSGEVASPLQLRASDGSGQTVSETWTNWKAGSFIQSQNQFDGGAAPAPAPAPAPTPAATSPSTPAPTSPSTPAPTSPSTPAPTSAPQNSSDPRCPTLAYEQSQWVSGFQFKVYIGAMSLPIQGWKAELKFANAANVVNAWSSKDEGADGVYTFSNLDYNAKLETAANFGAQMNKGNGEHNDLSSGVVHLTMSDNTVVDCKIPMSAQFYASGPAPSSGMSGATIAAICFVCILVVALVIGAIYIKKNKSKAQADEIDKLAITPQYQTGPVIACDAQV